MGNIEYCLLILFVIFNKSYGFIDGIYCGKENCYDVLGVHRDASKGEITKSYRQLARKYHPDMHRGAKNKLEAETNFTRIAAAYEVLKDEDSRKDYDYMLDNPEYVYQHYYRYYRRRVAPQVDVRLVLAVTITLISIIQYWSWWQRYNSAISYFITIPKYRIKALEIAKREGLIEAGKKKVRKSKDEVKEEEDTVIRKVLEENMDIRGGYAKPSVWDILWVQLVVLPYTLGKWCCWHIRWIWKFNICKQEYDLEEKYYLIRKYMGCSQTQFDSLSDEEKEGYIEDELWVKEKFVLWKEEQEEERKAKLAESARYKSYRRYVRQHGHGQISFMED